LDAPRPGRSYSCPDTGLYYFNARWYDSELGRFISEDPIVEQYIGKFNRSYKKYVERLEQQKRESINNNTDTEISYSDYLINDKEFQTLLFEDFSANGIKLYLYCNNNPLVFMDPDGQKPIKSNWFLGIFAHKAIQAHFLMTTISEGNPRVEVFTPKGRADMALVKRTVVEGWEIKPISYKENRLKNLYGKMQLFRELIGLEMRFKRPAIPGTSYNPNGVVIPFPGWEGAKITVMTFPEDPGMVFYQIDDGLPEGSKTNIPEYSLLKEALKGGLDVLMNFLHEAFTPPPQTDPILAPPPLPPWIPVPVF